MGAHVHARAARPAHAAERNRAVGGQGGERPADACRSGAPRPPGGDRRGRAAALPHGPLLLGAAQPGCVAKGRRRVRGVRTRGAGFRTRAQRPRRLPDRTRHVWVRAAAACRQPRPRPPRACARARPRQRRGADRAGGDPPVLRLEARRRRTGLRARARAQSELHHRTPRVRRPADDARRVRPRARADPRGGEAQPVRSRARDEPRRLPDLQRKVRRGREATRAHARDGRAVRPRAAATRRSPGAIGPR